jgi:hypothetical protein
MQFKQINKKLSKGSELFRLNGSGLFHPSQVILDYFNPFQYAPFHLFDNRIDTSAQLNGDFYTVSNSNPFFNISLNAPIKLDKLVFYNGYQKNSDLYFKNARIKELLINGQNFVLEDSPLPQIIKFSHLVTTNLLKLEVISIYPGTKYKDICLSELEIMYEGKKYSLSKLLDSKKSFFQKYFAFLWSKMKPETIKQKEMYGIWLMYSPDTPDSDPYGTSLQEFLFIDEKEMKSYRAEMCAVTTNLKKHSFNEIKSLFYHKYSGPYKFKNKNGLSLFSIDAIGECCCIGFSEECIVLIQSNMMLMNVLYEIHSDEEGDKKEIYKPGTVFKLYKKLK